MLQIRSNLIYICNTDAKKTVFSIMKGSFLDFFGFSASLLCAIHCALVPLMLTFSMLEGLHFLANPSIEKTVLCISLLIAMLSLLPTYFRHHHKTIPILIFGFGLLLIAIGRMELSMWMEVLLTSSGACCVAVAHVVNWKLYKKYLATIG